MKIYINESTDPYYNLAAEGYLLCHTSGDIFFLWRNSPTVVIGKNQNAFAEIDTRFTKEHNIAVVRRLTGGGAVFHDLGNVNFTFISPAGGELAEGIREGGLDFGHFTRPIIDALNSLGIKATLTGRNDIAVTVDGEERKISGNAQCVYNVTNSDGRNNNTGNDNAQNGLTKTLHHGTLLFSADFSNMQGALRVSPDKLGSKGIKSVRSRVANIASVLPECRRAEISDAEKFMKYIAGYVSSIYGVPVERFDESFNAGIEKLTAEKYSTDEWNFRRMGSFDTERQRRFGYGSIELRMSVTEGRIAALEFGGDFFGIRDVGELASRLFGVEYSPDVIAAALGVVDVGEYIGGASREDIMGLIFG